MAVLLPPWQQVDRGCCGGGAWDGDLILSAKLSLIDFCLLAWGTSNFEISLCISQYCSARWAADLVGVPSSENATCVLWYGYFSVVVKALYSLLLGF